MPSRQLEISPSSNTNGDCVLYVMSRDQRVRDNHALLAAQAEALEQGLPLAVVFNLVPKLGVRAREHYQFMVAGLKQVEKELKQHNIPLIITSGNMETELTKLVATLLPRSMYFDFSPLRRHRALVKSVAKAIDTRVVVVDTHNIVPVWVISDKQEFAAHTIRRKLHKELDKWLVEPEAIKQHPHVLKSSPSSLSWSHVEDIVNSVPRCGIKHAFDSGEKAAIKTLQRFIETGAKNYATERNNPSADAQSSLSPYLHYGQLSSLRIVLDLLATCEESPLLLSEPRMPSASDPPSRKDGIDAFIEELVVRKELSDNYCFYNQNYDSITGAPDWAQKTLKKHASDLRDFTYTQKQFEAAKTHDDIWNAAQLQLRKSGKIHGYMRMYWAKKILEWSENPEDAIQIAVYLNDHYSIDGGDPNGYVGILWSIAGLHDRPWFERAVYGTVRYMADSGLKKKFDTDAYCKQWL